MIRSLSRCGRLGAAIPRGPSPPCGRPMMTSPCTMSTSASKTSTRALTSSGRLPSTARWSASCSRRAREGSAITPTPHGKRVERPRASGNVLPFALMSWCLAMTVVTMSASCPTWRRPCPSRQAGGSVAMAAASLASHGPMRTWTSVPMFHCRSNARGRDGERVDGAPRRF